MTEREKYTEMFFEEYNGEIFQMSVECITNTIKIASFQKPTFTQAFIGAIRNLQMAAAPEIVNTAESNETYATFVREYGTHFIQEARLGSTLIQQKMYQNKTITSEEKRNRRICAEYQLKHSLNWLSADELKYYNELNCFNSSQVRLTSPKADFNADATISMGPYPRPDVNDWESSTSNHPAPLQLKLQKISALISQDNIGIIEVQPGKMNTEIVNATRVKTFLDQKNQDYCNLVLGTECSKPPRTCANAGNCPWNTVCVDDPLSDQGYRCIRKITSVVAGGCYGSNCSQLLRTVSLMPQAPGQQQVRDLPDLPTSTDIIFGEGKMLYSALIATTVDKYTVQLFSLDIQSASSTWQIVLEISQKKDTSYSSPVILPSNDSVWLIDSQAKVRTVKKSNGKTSTYQIQPAAFDGVPLCALSEGDQKYVVVTGYEMNQNNVLYHNKDPSRPYLWQRLATLPLFRTNFSCLLLDAKIFVSGGIEIETTAAVEVVDLATNNVTQIAPLLEPRMYHAMGVVEGNLAALGGLTRSQHNLNGQANVQELSNTIETYDATTNTWNKYPLLLDEPSMKMAFSTF